MKSLIRWTVAVLLAAMSASLYAETTLKWVGCGITKKAFMTELALAYEVETGVKIDIQGGGATRGIRDVVKGDADIGGACRHTIAGHNEELGAILEPVAWDALVVITHPDNPVEDISFEQVRGLYLGKIKNWKELGGNDAPIRLLARKGKNSGVGRTIRKLVFADFDQEFKASEFMKSSGPVEKGVEKDINAIGITGISSARKRNVKQLKLDGKEPSYDNIRLGEYGLYRPLYLVINREGKKRKEIADFLKFAHSADGKQVIRDNGTVPYLDALRLVMKQVAQEERAQARGLYR
ncbi:MAG: phosphate ABC transporter substrate-binding protein [Granulosicoccaceae bacterium]|jgi:phosphate transport system substrate-binding protein